MTFINLPGYKVRLDLISGVSDVKKTEEMLRDPLTKKESKSTLYHISLFFDGIEIGWYFENQEEAEGLRDTIDKILEEVNDRNILRRVFKFFKPTKRLRK
jgi:hypothetical protein